MAKNKYLVHFQLQGDSDDFDAVLVEGKTEEAAIEQYKEYLAINNLKARFVAIKFCYKLVGLPKNHPANL
jgi:hypothetical protein